MLRIKNKNKFYFYIFSLLFLSTITNTELYKILKKKFLINNIEVETNFSSVDNIIINETKNLLSKNIFFINKNENLIDLNKLNFLENINIKKIYPSKIIIKANLTKLIGITHINEKKYYLGENGKFISSDRFSNTKKLPLIFGKFDAKKFLILLKKLKSQQINHESITKYYYHKNKRWDIYFKNNILVKLPNNDVDKAIRIYKSAKKSYDIISNSIIDLRIANRLIILNE